MSPNFVSQMTKFNLNFKEFIGFLNLGWEIIGGAVVVKN
jgi:hypothetical protein